LATRFVSNRRKNRIAIIGLFIAEINPRKRVHEHAARKNNRVTMRRLHAVVGPRHRSGLDSFKSVKTILIRARPPPARERRIQWFFLLVIRVIVAAVSVGLPNLHHRIRHGLSVPVEHLTFDANPLALRRFRGHDIHWPTRQADRIERADSLRRGLFSHRGSSKGVAFLPRNTMSKRYPSAYSGSVTSWA